MVDNSDYCKIPFMDFVDSYRSYKDASLIEIPLSMIMKSLMPYWHRRLNICAMSFVLKCPSGVGTLLHAKNPGLSRELRISKRSQLQRVRSILEEEKYSSCKIFLIEYKKFYLLYLSPNTKVIPFLDAVYGIPWLPDKPWRGPGWCLRRIGGH
jgi:hypothetical protein